MIRRIECLRCFKLPRFTEPDVVQGWTYRTTTARVKKPKKHEVKVIGGGNVETFVLPSILCDQCGEPIKDGQQAKLVTIWNTRGEGEPSRWEEDFMMQDKQLTKG